MTTSIHSPDHDPASEASQREADEKIEEFLNDMYFLDGSCPLGYIGCRCSDSSCGR